MNKFEIGKNIDVMITGINEYGIFVNTKKGYTGMIHISEITDKFVDDISKLYVIGETLDAKILEIDERKKQLRLSIKEINSKKIKRKSIKEEGRGFEPLRENLSIWVSKKLEELEKNKKSK